MLMRCRTRVLLLGCVAVMCGCAGAPTLPPATGPATQAVALRVERVTTGVPFPRGLVMKEGTLYVISRGRVRDAGGTDPKIDDRAGTIWAVDPEVSEPAVGKTVGDEVKANARALAEPTEPPFRLLDRTVKAALDDGRTDRPYCILRYDEATRSFYFCAFSGIDRPQVAYAGPNDRQYFRKNNSDAVFRYDLRTGRYHLLYRNPRSVGDSVGIGADGVPDRLLSGPNNCLVVGRWLYVVAKETSTLVRFDLSGLRQDPHSESRGPELVAGRKFKIDGKVTEFLGHSMLASRGDGWLYLGFRTSSTIVRIRESELSGMTYRTTADATPVRAELVARFDPFDPETGATADLTDMAFGPGGELHVVSAKPARVYRFKPDAKRVFDGRTIPGASPAWAELWQLTGNPKMKSESVLVDEAGVVYVTSADRLEEAHGKSGLAGVVYRILP